MTIISKISFGKNVNVLNQPYILQLYEGLSRFLKPQSGTEEAVLQLSHRFSLKSNNNALKSLGD